ncbi:MAG: hydroxyacylglutathione hydrolase [Methylotetracoccus sp.]
MIDVRRIAVLNDNYVFLVHDAATGDTAAVDPAVAEPVLAELAHRGWRLTHILNTHHHGDHVGGNLALKAATGCRIIGATSDRARIPGIDVGVADGGSVTIGRSTASVLEVPGHTRGHIAYWFADDRALFCGDTLFALGCGRLFEGTAEEMWHSLQRLAALPSDASVYCAHEYTQANGRFALSVEPDNVALLERMRRVDAARARGEPTVPSTLAEELATNPFLRSHSASLRAHVGLSADAPPSRVFAETRRLKDRFAG